MAYIDKVYYDGIYKGVPITDVDVFSRLAERASDFIDQITNYVLHGIEFTSFAQFIQDQVKKATAAQVEFMYSQDSTGYSYVGKGEVDNVRIGNFSYANGKNEQSEQYGGKTNDLVISYLIPTGLLYSGVGVYDQTYSFGCPNS